MSLSNTPVDYNLKPTGRNNNKPTGSTGDFKKARVDIQKRISFIVGSDSVRNILLKDDGRNWRRVKIRQ